MPARKRHSSPPGAIPGEFSGRMLNPSIRPIFFGCDQAPTAHGRLAFPFPIGWANRLATGPGL